MPRAARPGQDIRKFITSRWYNETLKDRKKTSLDPSFVDPSPVRIPCLGATGLTFTRFSAANVTGPATSFEDWGSNFSPQYETLMCEIDDELEKAKWGIVQGPCDQFTPAKIVIQGLTWADFAYTSGDTHVTIVDGALKSALEGEAVIISPPASGQTIGLILLHGYGAGSAFEFFKTMEDGAGTYGPVKVRITNREGTANQAVVDMYWWANLLDGVGPNYQGIMTRIGSEYIFVQGPCVTTCSSNGSITPGEPVAGTVDEVYAGHTVASSDLNPDTLAASGLPTGLSMDTSGNITGTPTEAGTFYVSITGEADSIDTGTCTLTKILTLVINEAE